MKFCQWITNISKCCSDRPENHSIYCSYHIRLFKQLKKMVCPDCIHISKLDWKIKVNNESKDFR